MFYNIAEFLFIDCLMMHSLESLAVMLVIVAVWVVVKAGKIN